MKVHQVGIEIDVEKRKLHQVSSPNRDWLLDSWFRRSIGSLPVKEEHIHSDLSNDQNMAKSISKAITWDMIKAMVWKSLRAKAEIR